MRIGHCILTLRCTCRRVGSLWSIRWMTRYQANHHPSSLSSHCLRSSTRGVGVLEAKSVVAGAIAICLCVQLSLRSVWVGGWQVLHLAICDHQVTSTRDGFAHLSRLHRGAHTIHLLSYRCTCFCSCYPNAQMTSPWNSGLGGYLNHLPDGIRSGFGFYCVPSGSKRWQLMRWARGYFLSISSVLCKVTRVKSKRVHEGKGEACGPLVYLKWLLPGNLFCFMSII